MRMSAWVVIVATAMMVSDAWAMCGMGGGGSGARSGMRSGAGRGITVGGASSSSKSTKQAKPLVKAQLPAEETVNGLDTARLESVLGELSLTAEQRKKVDEVVQQLKDATAKLVQAQTDARQKYNKAMTEADCLAAGQAVVNVASACKRFDPNRDFESAVSGVLSADQRSKLRDLRSKS